MRLFLFLFLCLPYMATAQFIDDFESGNLDGWTQAPEGRWSAVSTTGKLSGIFSLRYTAVVSAPGSDAISKPISPFPLPEGHTVWRFLLRYSYNPTATNKWAIVLMSDTDAAHWSSPEYNGYAVGVNMEKTTSKMLCLYEVQEGTYREMINTGINWNTDVGASSTVTVAIAVTRSMAGEWNFSWAKTGQFEDLQQAGTAITNVQHTAASYFGAINSYTSSSAGAQKLWLDEITIVSSASPSQIRAAVQQGQHKIRVAFTQSLDATTIDETTSYTLAHAAATLTPMRADAINEKEVLLTFEQPLPRGNAVLQVRRLLDENHQEVTDEATVVIFYLHYGDVTLSEIMAAPTPAVGLPEVSYIEIHNRLELPVSLNGWKMTYNATVGNIGAAVLPPHGYLILCTSTVVEDMRVFGDVAHVSYMSSLTKSGKTLQLISHEGQLLSCVTYSDRWMSDETKRAGGWSLEKIDVNNLSETAANWTASTDERGGTPGMQNAVQAHNPDTEAPFVTDLHMLDAQTLSLTFSELFDTTKAMNTLCYTLNNGMGHPQQVLITADYPQQITLQFASPFVQGVVYGLAVSAPFCDLAGNAPDETPYLFGHLFTPLPGDVVINEVLFNPPPNGADFVEIYNTSDKIFDLRQMKLANHDKHNAVAAIQSVPLPHYLYPHDYAVFTTDLEAVQRFYTVPFPEKVAVLKALPSYPNAEGCVVLLNNNEEVVDEFLYSEKMHSGFIVNREGISLERVNPAVTAAERANWQSAAQDAGFATPTFRNSQFNNSAGDRMQAFSLRHTTFSPDGDGYQDVLLIDYSLPADGYEASLTVYDIQGRVVRSLGKNVWLGMSGSLSWDGTRENGQRALSGLFIVFIQCYDVRGNVSAYKLPCAVALR
jgi:hypothetical protein